MPLQPRWGLFCPICLPLSSFWSWVGLGARLRKESLSGYSKCVDLTLWPKSQDLTRYWSAEEFSSHLRRS